MAKILIVDDSIVSRKKLREILESAGHEIVGEACDGAEAFEKYQALLPDLVTMDITMPHIDGITVLKKIMDCDPHARVVMITALGKGDKILQALNAGAKNYITKPYEDEQIIRSLQEALEEL
ncbi:response regulator [Candidatus Formimonas warabiya]|uniref:Stage 0 sporulation protein A homolog n=1 Tax=Formimonas warabiya TaxID=1761012 RepID=A0A3G1KYH3_FORW1|nr:response regulator [Candidatus Formimonas warabiya]ATW27460.1 two-component system response regulator [Candidatus Formimonas warabiya]